MKRDTSTAWFSRCSQSPMRPSTVQLSVDSRCLRTARQRIGSTLPAGSRCTESQNYVMATRWGRSPQRNTAGLAPMLRLSTPSATTEEDSEEDHPSILSSCSVQDEGGGGLALLFNE